MAIAVSAGLAVAFLWWFAGSMTALTGLAVAALVVPAGWIPDLAIGDTWVHFLGFLVLALGWRAVSAASGRKGLAVVSLATFAVGAELLQGLVPTRGFDPQEIGANLAGVALALAVFALGRTAHRLWIGPDARAMAVKKPRRYA